MRKYTDDVCGSAWATDGYGENYLQVVTVNPLELNETGFSEVTICSNENYTHSFGFEGSTPAAHYFDHYYLQSSTDKGSTWTNVGTDVYTISLTPADFSAGDDIWYRFTYEFGDCDPVSGNAIHKIHVKEIPDYTGQFPDVNITLWYGACDTSIAALVPPVLTPTPASITRADSYGDRLTPGEYELRWNVIADDCNISVEYTQNVKVEYPACGTLAEPLTMTDNDGNEYQTIRIGCECWMAENLRANAPKLSITMRIPPTSRSANSTLGLTLWVATRPRRRPCPAPLTCKAFSPMNGAFLPWLSTPNFSSTSTPNNSNLTRPILGFLITLAPTSPVSI
jgi:hypothetical protein